MTLQIGPLIRSGLRALTPVGVIEARGAMAVAASQGHRPRHPLAAHQAMMYSRMNLLPSGFDLRVGPVVDLGANRGDWTAAVRVLAPNAEIVTVEPDPHMASGLRARFADDHKVQVMEAAVSDIDGEATFHVTSHSHNSSLQPPRDMNEAYGRGWDQLREVHVLTLTLDTLLDGRRPSLVKIDVQGAEGKVLQGGSTSISSAGAVLVEVTTRSHYEGDMLFPELHQCMIDLGHSLVQLSEPYTDKQGNSLWFDACYANASDGEG